MDFTHDEPHGTGLAMAELADDMITTKSPLRLALRASCDWQIYERNRNYKSRVWEKWHCIEGPFVVFHNDRYYMLYSGGAWYTENYGLGFAVADHPLGPAVEQLLPALPRTVPRGRDKLVRRIGRWPGAERLDQPERMPDASEPRNRLRIRKWRLVRDRLLREVKHAPGVNRRG